MACCQPGKKLSMATEIDPPKTKKSVQVAINKQRLAAVLYVTRQALKNHRHANLLRVTQLAPSDSCQPASH
jgi:hypothetical protein